MDLPTCENHTLASLVVSGASSEQSTVIETIDANKINSLLEFVRERLTSDVYGNFNLQGDRLAKDGRHTKLREVVELNRLLEDVKGVMERKREIPAMDEAQDARKTTKPNANHLAVVRDMIAKGLERGLRDVKIENDRLVDRLVNAEQRGKKAEADHAALQESVRKLGSGEMKGVRSFVKEEVSRSVREAFNSSKIEDRLAGSEMSIKKASVETETQMRALEATLIKRLSDGVETVKRRVSVQVSDANELNQLEVAKLREDRENDMDKLSTELLRWRTEHNDKLHSCDLWATDVLDSDSEDAGSLVGEASIETDSDPVKVASDGDEDSKPAEFGHWEIG